MGTESRIPATEEPPDATLIFHEQSDGRKVGRLPGGKVVLIDLKSLERVGDGEVWYVKLRHHQTFAIADPVERASAAAAELATGQPSGTMAAAFARARQVVDPSPKTEPATAVPSTVAQASTIAGEQPSVPFDMAKILRPDDRVAIFVDGANMDGASRAAGYFIDYRRTREFFLGPATFYAAFYYVADFTATDPLQQRFFDFLAHNGYIVRRRPVKVLTDPDTGERVIKGNLDTEIVLDLLNTVGNYDVAFLMSGDSDFERAVDLLRSRGKRVFVVSSRAQLSKELAYVADKPIFLLEDHRETMARTDRPART